MAKIKVGLNPKEISSLIQRLEKARDELKELDEELPKELAEQTSKQIVKYYALKGFSSDDKPTIGVVKYGKGYKAFIRGSGVIYEEFGTGDVGASNGHPWKGDYGLNPYNSGETIRPADEQSSEKYGIDSGLYWTYYDPVRHRMVATQGIPSGKFMYNADIWLRDNYKKIAKQKVDDILSKL